MERVLTDSSNQRLKVGRIYGLVPFFPCRRFETVLSDTNGYFRFVNLRPGAYRRCHDLDGIHFTGQQIGENARSRL